MLQDFLNKFQLPFDFQSSTTAYKSGLFNETIKKILTNYQEIKNTVLPTLGEDRRKTYSSKLSSNPRAIIIFFFINKATNDKTCDPFLFWYNIHGPFGFWFGVQFSTANLFSPLIDQTSV